MERNNIDKRAEKIDRYLLGEMEVDELTVFESKILGDAELANAVKLERSLHQVVQDGTDASLKNILKDIHQKGPPSSRPNINRGKIIWLFILAVAAAISLLIIFNPFSNPNHSASFYAEKHFTPYPDFFIHQGASDNTLTNAMNAYKKKDYATALQSFPIIPKAKRTQFTMVQIYKANCWFELNQSQKSIKLLLDTSPEAEPSLKESVDWYLALSYLKNDQKVMAIPLLQNLAKGGEYHKEARQLLKQIEEPYS